MASGIEERREQARQRARDRIRARQMARARIAQRQLNMGADPQSARIGGGLVDVITQGATFRLGDEATALEAAVLGKTPEGQWFQYDQPFGQRYERALGAERAQQKEFAEQHPKTAIAGELGGAVAGGLAMAPFVGPVVGAARLPGWLKAAGIGGAAGGAYGFGSGEGGLEPRLHEAGRGAAYGTAGGVLGHGAAQLGRKGAETLSTALAARAAPEAAAGQVIRRAFERDQITPAVAGARLGEYGRRAMLADVGGTDVKSLVRGTAGKPGPGRQAITENLERRAEEEAAEIAKTIQTGLDPQDYYAARDQFITNMKEKAAPLYEEAYASYPNISSEPLQKVVRSRQGQRAVRQTIDILENEQAAGQEITEGMLPALRSLISKEPDITEPVSLRGWDQIKRGFDALLDKPAYRNETTGRLNTTGRSILMMKRTLVNELDDATGGAEGVYARARSAYAGEAEALDALKTGRQAIKADPEVVTTDLAELSTASQAAYRSGFSRALMDIVDKTPDTAGIARRIWGNTRMRNRIRAAFPDDQGYRQFARAMAAEIEFKKTENMALAGSRTTPMAMDVMETGNLVETAGAMAGARLGGSGGGIILAGLRARVGRGIARGMYGPEHDKYYKALGRMLTSDNQASNRAVLEHLSTLKPAERVDTLGTAFAIMGGVSAEPAIHIDRPSSE